MFAIIFAKNFNLNELGISLPIFPSTSNLNLHNIPVTLTLIKKVKTDFDLSKVSGPDCISVVVLKNCES